MSIRNDIFFKITSENLRAFTLRFIGVASLFALNIVVARSIGIKEFGAYSFAVVVAALLSRVFSLGWPTALLRFVSQYIEQKDWSHLKGALNRAYQITFCSGIVAAVLLLAISHVTIDSIDLRSGLRFSALLTPLIILTSIRRMTFQALSHVEASIVPDEIIRPLLIIVGVYVLSVDTAMKVIVIYLVVGILLFLITGSYLKRKLPVEARKTESSYKTRLWLVTALPMTLGGIGFILMNRTDSLMLGLLTDMKTVGLYAVANRMAMMIALVLSNVEIVVTPKLSAAYHGNRLDEFKLILRQARKWIISVATPVLLIYLFWPELMLGIFGDEFAGGVSLLRILAIAQFVNASTGPVGLALLMTGRERLAAWMMAMAAIINIIGNVIAIPRWGAVGAAVSTSFCIVTLNVSMLLYVSTSKYYKSRYYNVMKL